MMRRILTGLAMGIAGWLVAPQPLWADCTHPFRNPDEILDFHLRMSRATWQQLQTDSTEPSATDDCWQYPTRQVEFRCGESEAWISVGARRKLGGAVPDANRSDQKPNLKLDFNEVVMGQRWPTALGDLGFRRLTLNNGQNDYDYDSMPVLLTEHVGWRFLHEAVPTSGRAAFARVTVHLTDDNSSSYRGLYVVLEDIDRTGLKKRYGDGDGYLEKLSGSDACNGVRHDDGPPNPTKTAYDAWFASFEPYRSDPSTLPPTYFTQAEAVLDFDELLRQEAVREIFGDEDSIFGNWFNNWYFFAPKTGDKAHYLPWDIDRMFRDGDDVGLTPECQEELAARTVCLPTLERRYYEIACELINGIMAPDRVVAEFQRVDALIRPILQEERALWGTQDPLGTYGDYQSRFDDIPTYLPAKVANIRSQLAAAGVTCPMGCTTGESAPCPYLTCAGVRECVAGRWQPCRPIQTGCEDLDHPRGVIPLEPTPGTGGSTSGSTETAGTGAGPGGPTDSAGTSAGTAGATGGTQATGPATTASTGDTNDPSASSGSATSVPAVPGGEERGGADPSGCACGIDPGVGGASAMPGLGAWAMVWIAAGFARRRRA